MMRFLQRSFLLCVLLVVALSCDQFKSYETTYVVPTVLNVRGGPSTKHKVIHQVRRGEELRIVERQETWINILLPDDRPGWVHGDYVGSPADVRASLERDLRRNTTKTVRRTPKKRSPTAPKSNALTIDGLLAGLPEEIPTEILPPIEGVERVMGAARDGQVVVEFWGDEDKLQRAMIMVRVLEIEETDVEANALYALGFVKNGMRSLDRDQAWMVSRLKEITSRDTGTGELHTSRRMVTFEFLKALGSVRITVEPVG